MVGIVVSAGVRTVLPPTLLDEQDPRDQVTLEFPLDQAPAGVSSLIMEISTDLEGQLH